MRREKRMKAALRLRAVMWSVLRVEMLAFARSFLAFCAIVLVVWEEGLWKSDLV